MKQGGVSQGPGLLARHVNYRKSWDPKRMSAALRMVYKLELATGVEVQWKKKALIISLKRNPGVRFGLNHHVGLPDARMPTGAQIQMRLQQGRWRSGGVAA
jgi:hypothetical protein